MRKLIVFFLFLTAPCAGLFAQIAIHINTSHAVFMQYDAAYIRMRLQNYSSHPITFGSSSRLRGNLEFIIRGSGKTLVKRIPGKEDVPILQGVILGPGEKRSFTINLLRYYSLTEAGTYDVQAVITHPQLPSAYDSNHVPLIIRSGFLLWEHKFGIPDYTGKNAAGKIRQRSYKLYKFSNGKVISFYLVVDDEKLIYAVKRIGFYLSGELMPQHEVDAVGRLHLMIAASQKVFAYYVYNYDGALESRQVYIKTGTTPFLVVNPKDSSVIVDGGRIARKDADYREIKDLPFMDSVQESNDEEQVFALPEKKDDGIPGTVRP